MERRFWDRMRAPTGRRRFLAGSVMAGTSAWLAACGGGGTKDSGTGGNSGPSGAVATLSPSGPATQAAEQPVKGGSLTTALGGDPPNLDMHANSTYLVNHAMAPAYNQLVRFDPADPDEKPTSIKPDLAKSWEQSSDGLKFSFKLNEGVTFHDGKPFSSADVKATLERMKNPPKGVVSPRQDSLAGIDKIETPDASTVVLTLKQPTPSLPLILAQGWMSMYSAKDIADNFDFKLKANGTGPFKLKEYVKGNKLTFDAFENYFVKGQPYLKDISYFIIRDTAQQAAQFQSGNLLFNTLFTPTDIKTLEKSMGSKMLVQRRNGFGFATINFGGNAPWRDERARRAVSLAMDRDAGIDLLAEGEAAVGGYMPSGGAWALTPEEVAALPGYAKYSDKTVAEAKALLSAAGVKDGHSINILTRQGKSFEDLSLFIADQLKRVGIIATPKVLEDAAAYEAINDRGFDMAPWSHAIALDDPDAVFSEFYTTTAPRNYSSLGSAEVDALFTKQSQTLNNADRVKLVKEMQKLAIPLYGKVILNWSLRRYVWNSRVRGYTGHVGLYNNNRHDGTWLTN